MEDHTIKLKQSQRDYLLSRVAEEVPLEDDKIRGVNLLKVKLAQGMLCSNDDLPENYVELNSIVSLKTSFGLKYGLQLVLPENADIQLNKLSIFSSLGCAVYGNKEGDKVKWFFQGEPEFAEIIKVIKSSENSTCKFI